MYRSSQYRIGWTAYPTRSGIGGIWIEKLGCEGMYMHCVYACAGVDSLNVSVTGGIMLWHLVRGMDAAK
jgi:hypothetical protein